MNNRNYSTCIWLCLLLLFSFPGSVQALDSEDCQGCHSDVETVGDELMIDAATYRTTAHAEVGCVACHESIGAEHPDESVALSTVDCLACHADLEPELKAGVHAENASCQDCHNPHQAYGLNEVSGYAMNRPCANCHDRGEVVSVHSEWLPQAELHIAKLPCISCHTASEDYVIILYLVQPADATTAFGDFDIADQQQLQARAGNRQIQNLIDLNSDNFVSLAELRTFNRNPEYQDIRLQATLTPTVASHSVQTLDNRWDCSFCHTSGTEKMQVSFLALPTAQGTFTRIEVERGAVLKALNGTPDFYMMGSTRSAALNIIGLLIICGGLLMPVGHGTLRFLTRKNRTGKED